MSNGDELRQAYERLIAAVAANDEDALAQVVSRRAAIWADVPDEWCCPDCGVREKIDFVAFDPTRERAS